MGTPAAAVLFLFAASEKSIEITVHFVGPANEKGVKCQPLAIDPKGVPPQVHPWS
jgi:hypothetical protein